MRVLERLSDSLRRRRSRSSRYNYEPLDHPRKIRLLTLHPGERTQDVRISLDVVALDQEENINFEALSYAWGTSGSFQHVYVRQPGESGQDIGILRITRNLAQALRYMRYHGRERRMWIDAICIDQHNIRERNHQVSLMADIYRQANEVVVWLGQEMENSFHAMALMQDLGSKVAVDWKHFIISPSEDSENGVGWADPNAGFPHSQDSLHAIYLLLQRPWFERLWIRQEIQLARRASVQCGFTRVEWEPFRDAAYCLYAKPGDYVDTFRQFDSLKKRLDLVIQVASPYKRYWLPDILYDTQTSKCADPRDRIYAMLGLLIKRHRELGIEPDYSKSVDDVFRDVFLLDLFKGRSLAMLCCCRRTSRHVHAPGRPSWIPDATDLTRPSPLYYSRSHGGINPIAECVDARTLKVMGLELAVVRRVIRMRGEEADRVEQIRKILPKMAFSDSSVGRSNLLDAYVDALCTGRFAEAYHPRRNDLATKDEAISTFVNLSISPRFGSGLSQEPTSPFLARKASEKVLGMMLTQTKERSFFETEQGYIGIGPKNMGKGDILCVLFGCPMPIILRPDSGRPGYYHVIGDAYSPGIMEGEAVLGSLRKYTRCVLNAEGANSKFPFVIKKLYTGRMYTKDPRIRMMFPGLSTLPTADCWIDEDGDINVTRELLMARFADAKEFLLL